MGQKKGVALIITLLVALVLFIAIITISSSLSISSRRVTTDQKVALEAQYAAESGLSLAAASVPDIGQEVVDVIKGDALTMPSGTDWSGTVSGYVQKFCGNGVPLSAPNSTRHLICEADLTKVSWTGGNQPYKVMEDYVDTDAYPVDPDTGHKYNPHKFWSQRIGLHTVSKVIKSGSEQSSYSVRYGFVPKEAWAYEDNSVHLIYKATATSVGKVDKSGTNLATRKVKQEFTGKLEIILRPPSFSRYMSFTNYQRAGTSPAASRVFFYNGTLFNGPVHTNEHFNFIDKPWFGDEVTSAGCTSEDRNKENCLSATPAFYYWDSAQRKAVMTPAPPDSFPPYAEPVYSKPPKWNDDYIPLPKVGNAQIRAAKNSGLFYEDKWQHVGDLNVRDIVLSIGTEGGKKYQYIQVWGDRVTGYEDVLGHCVKDPHPGGGGGGGGTNPPPGGGTGPDVWISPDLPLQVALAGTSRTSPVHWLIAAAHAIGGNTQYADQPTPPTCHAGYHWEWYVPPHKRTLYVREIHSYRVDETGRMEKLENGTWVLFREHFNGVIYAGSYNIIAAGNEGLPQVTHVNRANYPRKPVSSEADCQYTHTTWEGKDYCIEPSIASFTQLTMAGHWIGITRDITYEERPCESAPERNPDGTVSSAVCNNLDSENILGIYADTSSIRINYWAPPNMYIDAVLMAGKKSVYYHRWKSGPAMGDLHLTGGIIQNWYGRFGKLGSDMAIEHGYGRKFTYDPRLRDGGLTPPFFPTFDKGKWKGSAVFRRSGGGNGFWTPVGGN